MIDAFDHCSQNAPRRRCPNDTIFTREVKSNFVRTIDSAHGKLIAVGKHDEPFVVVVGIDGCKKIERGHPPKLARKR